jgi:hypothetical protein
MTETQRHYKTIRTKTIRGIFNFHGKPLSELDIITRTSRVLFGIAFTRKYGILVIKHRRTDEVEK